MNRDRVAADAEAGREAAFRLLAERHLEASYRLACAILGSPVEAQDATHDAFVQAWRKWPTLRNPDSLDAWFDRIVVNTCRNRLKRIGRFRMHELTDDIRPAGGDAMSQALDRQVIGAAMTRLSPDHRIVVALRYYRDLSVEDIAQRVGAPPGTVRSRLHYATQQLRSVLEAADAQGMDR